MAAPRGGLQGNQAGSSQYWFKALGVQNLLFLRLDMNSRRPKQDEFSVLLVHKMKKSSDDFSIQMIYSSSSVKTAKAVTQRNDTHLPKNYMYSLI